MTRSCNCAQSVTSLATQRSTMEMDQSCEDAFRKVKELVTSEQVLTRYDPEKPIKLACDASAYGIGAVISHIIEGHEKPIAFASRTLNPAEKKLRTN